MRSWLASLRRLVLPHGATTGARIILDGDTGTIQVYDVNNRLVAEIDPNSGIYWTRFTTDVNYDTAWLEGGTIRVHNSLDSTSGTILQTGLLQAFDEAQIHLGGDGNVGIKAIGSKGVIYDNLTGNLRRGSGIFSTTSGFEGWTAVSHQNAWTNWGAPHFDVAYTRDPLGYVVLRGVAKSGTLADNTVVFTLPADYRPASTSQHHVYGTVGSIINIEPDGEVRIYSMPGGANTPLALDGVRFPTF